MIGPLLYGFLFDISCEVKRPLSESEWLTDCIEYDQYKLRYNSLRIVIFLLGYLLELIFYA